MDVHGGKDANETTAEDGVELVLRTAGVDRVVGHHGAIAGGSVVVRNVNVKVVGLFDSWKTLAQKGDGCGRRTMGRGLWPIYIGRVLFTCCLALAPAGNVRLDEIDTQVVVGVRLGGVCRGSVDIGGVGVGDNIDL